MIDFDLDELLAETASDEGTNFALPFEDMTKGGLGALQLVYVRPN